MYSKKINDNIEEPVSFLLRRETFPSLASFLIVWAYLHSSCAYIGTKLNGRCMLRRHMGLWRQKISQKRIFLGITFLDLQF